jgi:carbamoyl-phosphate synthase large subunit
LDSRLVSAQTVIRKVKTLVVAGSPFLAHNAAACLWHAGCSVEILGVWGWSNYRLSRAHRRFERVDPALLKQEGNTPELVAQIEAYCRRRNIDVVVPGDVTATLAILPYRDGLRSAQLFPTPTHDQFIDLHDKWFFSRVAAACGSRHPKTCLIESPDRLSALDLAFPLIVKPLRRTAGEGVFRIDTPEDLARHVDGCFRKNELPIIAQEWIDGYDLDLTLIVDRGKPRAWTIQRRGAGFPVVEFINDPAILDLGRRIVTHTGYHGVVDFDIRFDERNHVPVVIEANPRFPGTLRFKLWAGVNFPAIGIAMALGESLPRDFVPPVGFCVDPGISPKRLLRALAHGHFVPEDLRGYSTTAWRMNYQDPAPHFLNWFASKLKREAQKPWTMAGTLSNGS